MKGPRKKYSQDQQIPYGEVLWANADANDGGTLVYFPQRKTVDFILKTLLEDCPERFPQTADARALFYAAKFQGNLLPLARAIDRSFGT